MTKVRVGFSSSSSSWDDSFPDQVVYYFSHSQTVDPGGWLKFDG